MRLPLILAFLAVAGIISLASAAGPCAGTKRVICFGGKASSALPPHTPCGVGAIDLSTGCVQAMLGGL